MNSKLSTQFSGVSGRRGVKGRSDRSIKERCSKALKGLEQPGQRGENLMSHDQPNKEWARGEYEVTEKKVSVMAYRKKGYGS